MVTEIVYVDSEGGTVECLGGPECNKIAYNSEAIPIWENICTHNIIDCSQTILPTNSVLCIPSINWVGSSSNLSENTSFTLYNYCNIIDNHCHTIHYVVLVVKES